MTKFYRNFSRKFTSSTIDNENNEDNENKEAIPADDDDEFQEENVNDEILLNDLQEDETEVPPRWHCGLHLSPSESPVEDSRCKICMFQTLRPSERILRG